VQNLQPVLRPPGLPHAQPYMFVNLFCKTFNVE
jgi:hypothetical protein